MTEKNENPNPGSIQEAQMKQRMYIQNVMEKMRKIKSEKDKKFKKIEYNILKPKSSKLATPYMEECYPKVELAKIDLEDVTKETLKLDKEDLRKEMKRRYRFSWKDPGYTNSEFNPPLIIKPNVIITSHLILGT